MTRFVLLALLLAGCGGTVASTDGCSKDFMLCMAGGDSGSTVTWASTGAVDIATCSGSLAGKPVELRCEVPR